MLFSETFNVHKAEADDWFDPVLSLDTKLFLDPFLLYALEDSTFAGSHNTVISFFNDVFALIAHSKGNRASVLWNKAVDLLRFPEVEELCLGYTGKGTKGSGSGKAVAKDIAEALWEAVQEGIKEITHFEEVQLLREGIGADRISDATAWLIRSRLAAYTEEICIKHGIATEERRYIRGQYSDLTKQWIPLEVNVPINPYNGKPILLVPRRYLRDLPTIEPDGFWEYCCHNENEMLRNEYSYDVSSRVDKKTIVNFARRHPDIRSRYIDAVEQSEAAPYDFEKDKHGYVLWYSQTAGYCKQHGLRLAINSVQTFRNAITYFLEEFKNFVENNDGWRLLWNEDGKPKREEAAQLLFLGIVKHYCQANDIDISREADIGRGPVDFKVSQGYQLRALLELKLAKNTKFWNGLQKQLPQYQKAEKIDIGYFIVILYSDKDIEKIRDIRSIVEDVNGETGYQIDVALIDARPNPLSASRL
jgi:hypothetical protein